jgi:hypothetical protein
LISIILVVFALSTNSQNYLHLYTRVDICKQCNNNVLNVLKDGREFLESKGIEFDLTLQCDRDRDLEDFRHYYGLVDSFSIKRYNSEDSLMHPANYIEYFVLILNDSVVLSTHSFDSVSNIIQKLPSLD